MLDVYALQAVLVLTSWKHTHALTLLHCHSL